MPDATQQSETKEEVPATTPADQKEPGPLLPVRPDTAKPGRRVDVTTLTAEERKKRAEDGRAFAAARAAEKAALEKHQAEFKERFEVLEKKHCKKYRKDKKGNIIELPNTWNNLMYRYFYDGKNRPRGLIVGFIDFNNVGMIGVSRCNYSAHDVFDANEAKIVAVGNAMNIKTLRNGLPEGWKEFSTRLLIAINDMVKVVHTKLSYRQVRDRRPSRARASHSHG